MPTISANSFAIYLDYEETSLDKHEFIEGQLFVMPNETDPHNRIAGRIYAQLLAPSEALDCRIYFNGLKVRTPDGAGYIPDIFICCDQNDLSDPRVRENPCFILEVASVSTEAIDRGEKLHRYQTIPTLEMYTIFAQDNIVADVYQRQHNGTWQHKVLRQGDTLQVPCVQYTLSLEQIYKGIL